VTILQHHKHIIGIFSRRMRRSGYLGASGQKADPRFAGATSISFKTDAFPLPCALSRDYA